MSRHDSIQHMQEAVTTLICVNQTNGMELGGVFYNPCLAQPVRFSGNIEIIRTLENLFDEMGYPRAAYSARSFLEQKVQTAQVSRDMEFRQDPEGYKDCRGSLVTFQVSVLYRQNATWQGNITWMERRLTRPYRSLLELLRLMNAALVPGPKQQTLWEGQSEEGTSEAQ